MSNQRQEAIANLASKKSLTAPLTITEGQNQQVANETRISRDPVLCSPNRDEHIVAEVKKVKANFRPVQLTTLSKVVDRAFTGWTIKTEK